MRVDRRNTGLLLPSDPVPHADLVIRVAGCGTYEPAAATLAPTVGSSWRRCLNEFNLDPAVDYQPTVVDLTRVKDLQAEHDELVQIARAEMDSLYEQISGSGYALLLADTSGVILCEKIDPTLKRMFVQAGLIVGAEWSEQREGTNGIGTCAAESRPITIHQSDHFRSRHIGLSCSAAPSVSPDGIIVATDMTGLRLLGAKEHKDVVGRSVADIFDATFDELLATTSSSRRAMYELRDNLHGRRYFASLAGAGQHNSHVRVTTSTSSRSVLRVAGAKSSD